MSLPRNIFPNFEVSNHLSFNDGPKWLLRAMSDGGQKALDIAICKSIFLWTHGLLSRSPGYYFMSYSKARAPIF